MLMHIAVAVACAMVALVAYVRRNMDTHDIRTQQDVQLAMLHCVRDTHMLTRKVHMGSPLGTQDTLPSLCVGGVTGSTNAYRCLVMVCGDAVHRHAWHTISQLW
eukprot:1190143-Pyramimonas_sp.AAC.1